MHALRLELFVADLAAALDFYRRLLGFRPGPSQPGGYTPLELTDFRVSDPDGYYWRVTSRREEGRQP